MLDSDLGSVYTSDVFQQTVKQKSITMLMSLKGIPVDNAFIECFNSTILNETFYLEPILKVLMKL